MKIAITGAGGLVGSSLHKLLAKDHQVIALRHADLDITNHDAVQQFAVAESPDVIINCAVLNVDECETDREKALALNVTGPQYLSEAARNCGAAIVHYSTNYVFDGKAEKIYTINDATEPVNNYGQTKLDGEVAVMEACARSFVIRTSWVYGVGKENFLSIIHKNLTAGKRGKVINDCWASAMYVEDLSARTLEIIESHQYGIYQVVNEGVASYVEFTYEAGRLVGLSETQIAELVELISDADIKRPAIRPRYTPMSCVLSEEIGLEPLRNWKDALAEYVAGADART